jgi:hypothetical protein
MGIENIFVAERFIDSLLLFRRQVCLPLEDLALSLKSANVPAGATLESLSVVEEVPPALRNAIRKLQWGDQLLYEGAVRLIEYVPSLRVARFCRFGLSLMRCSTTCSRRLLHENDVPAEQTILREYIEHMTARCDGYQDKPDSELVKGLAFTPGAYFNMVVGNAQK